MRKLYAFLLAIMMMAYGVNSFAQDEIKPVKLSFFTESQGYQLKVLLDDESIKQLVRLKAGIKMGLTDLSDSRAEVVQKLNKAGIPVTAWLLLPKKDGYWMNAYNHELSKQRYRDFATWSAKHKLEWDNIGLSFESYASDQRVINKSFMTVTKVFFKRILTAESQYDGDNNYLNLMHSIRRDGHKREVYLTPYELDSRTAQSEAWHNLNGTMKVASDREVPIFFNHFSDNAEHALAQHIVYGQNSNYSFPAVIVGSFNEKKPLSKELNKQPFTLEHLYQHFHIARAKDTEVWAYGLEGAIQESILPKIDLLGQPKQVFSSKQSYKGVITEKRNVEFFMQALRFPELVAIFGALLALIFLLTVIKTLRLTFAKN
ncbi:hypothetical protein V6R21_14950 [Limibacter armeniacum]|uniref:hypothetical protein n=1 Tax=Limibacter armeniacum TaxID=466084 RepID=UPI002FE6AEC6